jgi:ATPase subunit of ABC transporter with duplicated ATPase domains
LDEPTNFLDLESVQALTEAVKTFQGGVVLVSHDARLISQCDFELWECTGGLEEPDGGIRGCGLRIERRGFEAYRSVVMKRIAKAAKEAQCPHLPMLTSNMPRMML